MKQEEALFPGTTDSSKTAPDTTPDNAVQLEEPGAGIHPLEVGLLKFIVLPAFGLLYGERGALKFLEEQTKHILKASSRLTEEELHKPVLIERIHGIEDSSRNWSVAQVIEHLDIVVGGATHIIEELIKDKADFFDVKIEDVKPMSDDGVSPVQFAVNIDAYLARLRKIENIKQYTATNNHPWFGPFTAYQWLLLLAIHQNLHFRQIQKIIKNLTS